MLRCQNQSILLNWEMVSRSMPVVKLLPVCDNLCSSSIACSGLSLSPSQEIMIDSIQMGLRIIRLGCSRFTIEHRSYQFIYLQGTNAIQIFLFAFCDLASLLLIRSPSRNQCDQVFLFAFCDRASVLLICSPSRKHLHPTLSPNGGDPVRRSDHFWVRSRKHLKFEALACHPRTTGDLETFFLLFRFFFVCLVFLYPF